MNFPDSTVIENVYDHIFRNTDLQFIDFCEEFPASWVDEANATIYLAKNEGVELFKIKIEKV